MSSISTAELRGDLHAAIARLRRERDSALGALADARHETQELQAGITRYQAAFVMLWFALRGESPRVDPDKQNWLERVEAWADECARDKEPPTCP